MKKIIVFLIFAILLSISFTTVAINKKINTTDNNPPNPPGIDGPTSGIVNEEYIYYVTVTDPDRDDRLAKLEMDFGDGVISEDCGCDRPWENGHVVEMNHIWKRQGTYEIKARVMDVHGVWSNWSDPIPVNIPRSKQFKNNIFEHLSEIFFMFQKILLK